MIERQYALAAKAVELGWSAERVTVIDEDLGLSGSGSVARSGLALASPPRLRSVTSASCSGLRSHGWRATRLIGHRLIDLCGLTYTLIGDADGIYHPSTFNDRLLLGLKGTMSEAELYVLRARLNGGIRNKAARGELRRGLPVGFVWGDANGEVRFHSDEAVVTAIRNVFVRFAEEAPRVASGSGSARKGTFPLQLHQGGGIRWVDASYTAIHMLTNPVY